MSGPSIQDMIGGLRAEARQFRERAKRKREEVRRLKSLPIGQRQPFALLEAEGRVTEYVRSAQQRDELCAELRARLGPSRKTGGTP